MNTCRAALRDMSSSVSHHHYYYSHHHHHHNNIDNNISCIRICNNNKNRSISSIPPHSHSCSLNSQGQKRRRWVWRSWCLAHWWRKHNPIRLCSHWGSLEILWRQSVTSALRHMLRSDDTQNCTMTSSIGWYQLFNSGDQTVSEILYEIITDTNCE